MQNLDVGWESLNVAGKSEEEELDTNLSVVLSITRHPSFTLATIN